jgi:hypothetical protein
VLFADGRGTTGTHEKRTAHWRDDAAIPPARLVTLSELSRTVTEIREGGEMATMEAILETVSGLYRDAGTGRGYRAGELLSALPHETLRSRVRIQRSEMGIYVIKLDDGSVFNLYSRRRSRRGTE